MKMINAAEETWASNTEIKHEVQQITDQCSVCKVFTKPPLRRVVSLPMSVEFQETVAMDLKEYKG